MDFLQSLESFSKTKISTNFSLKNYNGYRVGGNADYFVQPNSVNQIRTIVQLAQDFKVDYKVIGNGTNLLFSDKGYRGVVICTKNIKGIITHNGRVICSCGERLQSLINYCCLHGFSGLEPLYGIPACVGGAVVMNAGAFGVTVSDYIDYVEFLDNGKLLKIDKQDLGFNYRTSLIKKLKNTVLSVAFNFPKTNDKTQSKELIKYYTLLRQKTQPKGNSCGSVFTNPENLKAGYLIEQAGLKGYSVNKAKISTKHANFIITEEGATATDVCNLINYVKTKVKEKFNVELTEEIEYVGEF